MPQQFITRRFRSRARIITVAALAFSCVVVVGGAVAIALAHESVDGIVVAHMIATLAIIGTIGAFAIMTRRHTRTMKALARRYPNDIVFLARRLPPVVSDLPSYLRAKGIAAHIGDGWYAAVTGPRGIAVYSSGSDPKELVLVEWAEIGDAEMVRTPTVGGDSRWSVAVEVKPFAVPLTIDLGNAFGIVTMSLSAADTAAIVQALEARRP